MESYLIAVLKDRIQAEEAYTALEKVGIAKSQITILGQGYKSADEFGLIDPNEKAQKQIRRMAVWLIPFGFAAGYAFNTLTQITVLDWAGDIGNHIFGGLLGAIGGAMGSYFIGGGVGLSSGSGDALPYRNRLNAGKYLVVVQGSEGLKQKATQILQPFEPESLQGYAAPIGN